VANGPNIFQMHSCFKKCAGRDRYVGLKPWLILLFKCLILAKFLRHPVQCSVSFRKPQYIVSTLFDPSCRLVLKQ